MAPMDDNDLGVLSADGERWRLTFTRRLPHPLDKVWRAVTEPAHLEAWFPQRIVGERRAGAALRFDGADGFGFDGTMLVFDPPSVMELIWGTDRLRIELSADGDGTIVTLIDTFQDLGKAARDAAGWHECLAFLARALAGRPPVARGSVWRDVHPVYVSHLGPEAATIGPPPGLSV